ncbi:MAG: Hpt domain-containing protein, partial [Lachnospiraceae bacterium]|nr:Hpt domain-containing protein [Lachnospiraceae bacterium]
EGTAVKKSENNEEGTTMNGLEYNGDESINDLPEEGQGIYIEGMDYDAAMHNCAGDEDILMSVLTEIKNEAPERIARMRELAAKKDYAGYEIEAHALKGLMATIGMNGLSERAKKHEFAVKEGNYDIVDSDVDGLLAEYEALCKTIKREINGIIKRID